MDPVAARPSVSRLESLRRFGRSLGLRSHHRRRRPPGVVAADRRDAAGMALRRPLRPDARTPAWAGRPARSARDPFLILSTQGGLRAPDGTPIALGYHTGHWEVGLLVQEAAEELQAARRACRSPGMVSDPCDGRTQGTAGMMDSLPYRNDAAIVFRRLIRSLPAAQGRARRRHLRQGPAGDDDGPGRLDARPAVRARPRRRDAAAAATARTPARSSRSAPATPTASSSLEEAAELGCRACASPGGGCQFLGTAATSQVVAEALGLTLPHAALAPSGQPIWLDMARRSARALVALARRGIDHRRHPHRRRDPQRHGRPRRVRRLDQPAAAHPGHRLRGRACAGPTVDDWHAVNVKVPRLVERPAQRPGRPSDRARLPGRRRARGDAPPARRWACST